MEMGLHTLKASHLWGTNGPEPELLLLQTVLSPVRPWSHLPLTRQFLLIPLFVRRLIKFQLRPPEGTRQIPSDPSLVLSHRSNDNRLQLRFTEVCCYAYAYVLIWVF